MSNFKFNAVVGEDIVTKKKFEAEFLDDVLFNFTDFLRGVGYVFDGNVKIVKEQSNDIPSAYSNLREELHNDKDYANTWHDNIVLSICDHSDWWMKNKISPEEANKLAKVLMYNLFGVKFIKNDESSEQMEFDFNK